MVKKEKPVRDKSGGIEEKLVEEKERKKGGVLFLQG